MDQAIAKINHYVVHIICRLFRKNGNIDNNSNCSNVAVEAAEDPLVAINNDSYVISVQTSDDHSGSSATVESKEQLITADYNSHVISIQPLDAHSSSSAILESKEPLISVITEDEDHAPSSADKSICSNYSTSKKEIAKEEEITAATIPKSTQVKLEDKWLRHYEGWVEELLKRLEENTAVTIPKRRQVKLEGKWVRHYCSNHKILLVGEGDFSFSACLAKAFGDAANMVATSLDPLDFLEKNYPSVKSNIGFLMKRGCIVLHGVDATKMQFNSFVNEYVYDIIIFNFPLAGFFDESRRQQLRRNRRLVSSFLENARELIASDGEIHITHKTSSFYREWGLEDLAKQCRLKLIEDVEFKLKHYPGYHNKYGFGGNRDFHCNPSRTYKFCHKHYHGYHNKYGFGC